MCGLDKSDVVLVNKTKTKNSKISVIVLKLNITEMYVGSLTRTQCQSENVVKKYIFVLMLSFTINN